MMFFRKRKEMIFLENENNKLRENGLQLFLYKNESGIRKLLLNDKVFIQIKRNKYGNAQVISITNIIILLRQLNSLDIDYLKQIKFVGLIPQIIKKNEIIKD